MNVLTGAWRADERDLARVRQKAELVHGGLRVMEPTGFEPGVASIAIAASLRAHARLAGRGRVVGDNVGFIVDLPHRRSFSPDAAYVNGRFRSMGFYRGAPDFAVEVRSEHDYGPVAEREMAAKRADYFAAGTRVVWDVDLQSNEVVKAYRADAPDAPTVFRLGEVADAEPAVPGWRMAVDELFDE